MKTAFRKYCLLVLLGCLFFQPLMGQGRVYTKTMRLSDFPQKTTKVVLSGQTVLDSLLKEEITSRWRISPFEFCSPQEFKAIEHDTHFYFLHLASDADFTYMLLTKGGPMTGDALRTAMEVVSIPISAAGTPTSEELVYLPAFIDIVQEYLQAAMVSETVSYNGLKGIVHKNKRGKLVYYDWEEGRKLFLSGAPDTIVPVLIWPSSDGRRRHYYKMMISTDNHLLYEFSRKRM